MIEQRVHAGLCNRMKEMASAIALARSVDQPLVVYWLKNKYLNCSFGRLFEPIEGVSVVDVETGHWKALLSLDSLRYRFRALRAPIDLFLGNEQIEKCKAEGTDLAELVAGVGHTVVITYYRFLEGQDSLSDFKPRRHILEQTDETVAQMAAGELIGVHIRGTDNSEALEKSPVGSFVARMESEVERDPETRFFLATDDPTTERMIKEQFPGRVATRPKVFARDKQAGVEDALIDLLVLSRCQFILGSHWSSFTEVAAEIGAIPLEIVGGGVEGHHS